METIEKKQIAYIYDAQELEKLTLNVFDEIQKLIKENNYTLSDKSVVALNKYYEIDWGKIITSKSKNMRKNLNKYIRKFNTKQNIYSANLLFHFLHTRILSELKENSWSYKYFANPEWIDKVKLLPPKKEIDIQDKRKVWIEARNKALEALKEYKAEKGDYYKVK